MSRWTSPPFPWATFTINVSGSFAIGLLTVALAHWLPHPNVRLLVVVGFLGGYTTFSTFSFETLTLWERGELRLSLANMVGSVLAGLLAVALGVVTARGLIVPRPERARKPVTPVSARVEPHRPTQAGDGRP
jgi:CrcB protein